MASYAYTRDTMLLCYPAIFIFETDILNHLFFTIGNGYHWKHGQLIDPTYKTREHELQHIAEQKEAEYQQAKKESERCGLPVNDVWLVRSLEEERLRTFACRMREIELGTEWCYLHGNIMGQKIYPLCKYSRILNIPPDVKPDWLAAAKLAIKLARSPIFRCTDNDYYWLDKAEKQICQLKYI